MALFLGDLPPCCTDTNVCGLDLSATAGQPACIERDAPGVEDAACPAAMVGGGLLTFPGCCRPDGTCGVLVDLVPLGCVDGELANMLPGGAATPGGPPASCSPVL